MTDFWFDNPKILLKNLDEFIPERKLGFIKNINAIIRFTIYYSILIILLEYNINYLYISLILIIISYYYGNFYYIKENFNDSEQEKKCTRPTEDNPFMNYTIGDLLDNSDRSEACKYDDIKDEMREKFRKNLYSDSSDLWGKYISDRNFYTMPNTNIVNNQKEFAEWCYGNQGKYDICKETGKNCLKYS
jgi:hypothetical protein